MIVVGPARQFVTETEVDGNVNLYSPSTQQVLILNETASDVWRLADGEHTTDGVVDLLARAYQVEADAIRDHVEDTIATFVRTGLIPPVG